MAESAASSAQKVMEVEELKDTRASLSASLAQSKEEPCVSNDQRSSDGQGDECSASDLRLVDSELRYRQGGPCRRCRCFECRQGRACWGRQLFVRRVKSRNRDQTHAAFQHPSKNFADVRAVNSPSTPVLHTFAPLTVDSCRKRHAWNKFSCGFFCVQRHAA